MCPLYPGMNGGGTLVGNTMRDHFLTHDSPVVPRRRDDGLAHEGRRALRRELDPPHFYLRGNGGPEKEGTYPRSHHACSVHPGSLLPPPVAQLLAYGGDQC